jgi:localization factor PodJL
VRDSQYNLAILYARGLGVAQDLGQSWVWFSLAADQGDSDAAKKRDEVAAKLDANGLSAAKTALANTKIAKPEPLSNDVASPVGGWDAKPGSAQSSPNPAAPLTAPPRPQALL